MYAKEQDLVADFLGFLRGACDPWGVSNFAEEFDYSAGRTDIVAADCDGLVLAFEAKLQGWRGALAQAYRNRCFAHRSYVVLPTEVAYQALRFEPEFRRRGVGICVVSNRGLIELLDSTSDEPSLTWLSRRALGFVKEHSLGRLDDEEQ